jgi:NB-ARC domain
MGGVGKTQLAADYARTSWAAAEVDLLVWVTATDRAAVVAGLGRAGVQVTGVDASDLVAAAEAFVAWLEPKAQERPCRWLLVLDDVADPADLAGLWPPVSPHGRTLITTRRRDAAFTFDGRTRIEVGLFTPTEAISYLTEVLAGHERTEPVDQLAALAEDLGRLPLALSQAAAFMIDADMRCDAYRALLTDRTRTLADASPQSLPPGHSQEMAAAWDLSIQRADAMRPAGLAQPLLHLTSLLDPNGIPAAVLTTPATLVYLTEHRTGTPGPPTTEQAASKVTAADVTAGLRVLHGLSLIDHTPGDPYQSVRVHALIQQAVLDTLPPQPAPARRPGRRRCPDRGLARGRTRHRSRSCLAHQHHEPRHPRRARTPSARRPPSAVPGRKKPR